MSCWAPMRRERREASYGLEKGQKRSAEIAGHGSGAPHLHAANPGPSRLDGDQGVAIEAADEAVCELDFDRCARSRPDVDIDIFFGFGDSFAVTKHGGCREDAADHEEESGPCHEGGFIPARYGRTAKHEGSNGHFRVRLDAR